VVTHKGPVTDSGHYIAHVRQPCGRWYMHSDADVHVVAIADVLKEVAYLLLYLMTP